MFGYLLLTSIHFLFFTHELYLCNSLCLFNCDIVSITLLPTIIFYCLHNFVFYYFRIFILLSVGYLERGC